MNHMTEKQMLNESRRIEMDLNRALAQCDTYKDLRDSIRALRDHVRKVVDFLEEK